MRFWIFREIFWVHENLGELTPAIFRDWEENPAVFVVTRRYLRAARGSRSASLGAAAPPLPKKSLRVQIFFGSPFIPKGNGRYLPSPFFVIFTFSGTLFAW